MVIYRSKMLIFDILLKIFAKKFGSLKNVRTFAIPKREKRGNSSVGRAQPCQGWGREFEPRFPLQKKVSRDADLNFAKPDEVQLYMQSFSYRDGFFYFTDSISASIFFGMSVFFMTQPNASAPAPYANTGTTVPV